MIDTLLRNDLIIVDEVGFAPLDDTGTQLLFRFIAAAYERRSLGIGSHWSFEQWGRFLPEHTTAVSLLDRLSTTPPSSSPKATHSACSKPENEEDSSCPKPRNNPRSRGLLTGHQRGLPLGP